MQEALLHAVVGANLLQNIPGKLAVELVGDGAHGNGGDADNGGDGDEEGENPDLRYIQGDDEGDDPSD